MRICDHQDAVCGNLSAAPPFRLTQFYISWQTNCLRDMCAPQIVYDAFELSFKQGAKKTSKRRKNLVVQRSSELQIQLWPIWWGERAKYCNGDSHSIATPWPMPISWPGMARFQLTSRAINETFHTVCLWLAGEKLNPELCCILGFSII